MNIYRTHLIVTRKDAEIIKHLSFPNHSLILKEEPSLCFWESSDGGVFSQLVNGYDKGHIGNDDKPQLELIIKAESDENAEDLLEIIHGGMLLAYPEPDLTTNFTFISEINDEFEIMYREEPFRNYFKRFENIRFGCEIASEAINDNTIIYAIEKYKISLELSSFAPHSANPKYGQVFNNYNVQHQNHTRYAFAIISAFSVIEELELEIRSSSKKHRFTNNDEGIWNEEVYEDIVKRLEQVGIANDSTFDWIYRGTPTRIENDIKPLFGYDSKWTDYGEDIRDKTLTFPQAIHNASYLRNFIAAHKFNELTQFVSPYDVFNIQCLARQLILNKIGFWNKMLSRNK